MTMQRLIILLFLALAVCTTFAQAQSVHECAPPGPGVTRTNGSDGSVSEVAQQGEDASPAELENEALRSLLGKEEEKPEPEEQPVARTERTAPAEETRPRETTGERIRPEPEERTTRPRERERPRIERSYTSDSAVPEVPVTADDEEGYQRTTEETEAPDEPAVAPVAPLSDYRSPFSGGQDDAYEQPEEAEPAPAEETPAEATEKRKGSPASAIIIGLIALAVLLVGLAAVVGIMAAQRAPREAAPVAAAAANVGWAYLTAPEAPDIPISSESFVMGSDRDCDLRLADPKASPHHARIDETDDGWVLVDLGSVNGTYLNGERIASPVTLRPGDEIQMGDIVVNFEVYQ